jgi:hypothetical protein
VKYAHGHLQDGVFQINIRPDSPGVLQTTLSETRAPSNLANNLKDTVRESGNSHFLIRPPPGTESLTHSSRRRLLIDFHRTEYRLCPLQPAHHYPPPTHPPTRAATAAPLFLFNLFYIPTRVGCVLGVCWVCVGCVLGVCWVCVGCVLGVCWVCVGMV